MKSNIFFDELFEELSDLFLICLETGNTSDEAIDFVESIKEMNVQLFEKGYELICNNSLHGYFDVVIDSEVAKIIRDNPGFSDKELLKLHITKKALYIIRDQNLQLLLDLAHYFVYKHIDIKCKLEKL